MLHIYQSALEMIVRHPRTSGRSQSLQSLCGTPAPRPGKSMKCFLASAGGHNRLKNRLYLSSAFTTALNLLKHSHLIAFFSLATNSSALYFHHLTHIQNCFLVGAAPETQSKPLIQLQITDQKKCHFSFRPFSIPQQLFINKKPGRHTFFMTFTHPSSCDQLIMFSHQLLC